MEKLKAAPPIASCNDLIESLSKTKAEPEQVMVIAESLMRSYEVKKYLAEEFRVSKNGVNWVANSSTEVQEIVYLELASILRKIAENYCDLRFINTAMKILEEKCPSKSPSEFLQCRRIAKALIDA
ncbi:MAG: hypothetical protein P8J33_01260 [Pirellulaceae bacterium]|nr:hypothetical protein [Pirellulaceae bacterium]